MDGRLYVRADSEELAAWKLKAIERGMGLSEWVRKVCNAECEIHHAKDVPVAVTE
jgi:hypothetical protein